MATRERRERERERRHRLIVTAARELAEAEGWEAVTTRRLAERIEYSQPVLYSHFSGKDAIVAAVALEGFAELAEAMRAARSRTAGAEKALHELALVYADFAETKPALYEAMFILATELPFARADTPAPLRAAFNEIFQVLAPLAGDGDPETFTEIGWSAIHGLVALERSGRLRPGLREERMAMLVERLFLSARG